MHMCFINFLIENNSFRPNNLVLRLFNLKSLNIVIVYNFGHKRFPKKIHFKLIATFWHAHAKKLRLVYLLISEFRRNVTINIITSIRSVVSIRKIINHFRSSFKLIYQLY